MKRIVISITALSVTCAAIAWAENPAPDSRAQAQVQAHTQIEQHRKQAEQQARSALDNEAIAAIKETQMAIEAISQGNERNALSALERATGKINVLVARSPANALIPVEVQVELIDTAPLEVRAIKRLAAAAEDAVSHKDYPGARVLLQGLISEIRVRTYNLPLATYPIAMQDAARLLDQGKPEEAKALLLLAVNTLAVIDHVTPLPLATAQQAIEIAHAQRDKDKDKAQKYLSTAKAELDRAKELGYAGNDPEYAVLTQAISEIEKQFEGNQDTGSAFTKLKEKVASFFKRQSESEKKAEVAKL